MPWRIVHVTTVHDVSTDTRIVWREAASQAARGHDVHVIARGVDRLQPPAGVTFHSLPQPSGRLDRLLRLGARATRQAAALGPDFVHVHDPELMPLMWLVRRRQRKLIYDAHEDLPQQVLSKTYLPRAARRAAFQFSRGFVRVNQRLVDGVVCATPQIETTMRRAPSAVVQNFPIVPPPPPPTEKSLDAIYVGVIATSRGLVEVIDALGHSGSEDATLTLIGPSHEAGIIDRLKRSENWRRVNFLGPQVPSAARQFMRQAKIGMCVLHPTKAYVDSFPTKLFEYLAEGIPVIASDFPLWRSMLDGADCAILVDPLDSRAIGNALGTLLGDPRRAAQMGRRGRELVLARYSWQQQEERLDSLYQRVARGAGAPSLEGQEHR